MNQPFLVAVATALFASSVHAQCPFPVQITGACTSANFKSKCSSLDIPKIETACQNAAVNFGTISGKPYQFDKNFMDGDTYWNEGTEVDVEIKVDGYRVDRFQSNFASNTRVAWPEYDALDDYLDGTGPSYMSNFNLTETCDLRAVSCCFRGSRGAPFPAITMNSDVCHQDLDPSRRSNHINDGWSFHDSESDANIAHCVGFAWADDENTDSHHYRGNALFDVSFANAVMKGYGKNVPGAPLCGCVEMMPVVTNVECRKPEVKNQVHSLTVSGDGNYSVVSDIEVDIVNCATSGSNNLVDRYLTEAAATAEELDQLKKLIVGPAKCDHASFANDRFWTKSTDIGKFETIDSSKWQIVSGLGTRFWPLPYEYYNDALDFDTVFRSLLQASPNKIVRRVCDSCLPSHRDIYYKRLNMTSLPPADVSFVDYFLSNWTSINNQFNEDFQLFSTYEDAIAGTNPWLYCNFQTPSPRNKVGFPRDCGPGYRVNCQWNTYLQKPCSLPGGGSHVFFVEAPPVL